MLTYEQLVLEPRTVLTWLAPRIDAPNPERMIAQARVPSFSVGFSFDGSKDAVAKSDHDYLIRRWRKSVDAEQERHLMGMLEAFGLDAYKPGQFTSERYWLSAEAETARPTEQTEAG